MKRFFYYAAIIFLFVACSDSGEESGGNSQPTTEIKLDVTSSDFTTDGGNNIISFTTNNTWTAQVINFRADDWCQIHPTSGPAGDATITVTTTPNNTPNDRRASIVIKAGAVSKIVTVSQKQKDALTVTSSKFEVAAEGGEVKIEVKANIDFEYAIDEAAQGWIKYEGTRAMETSTRTFKVAKNDNTEKREGMITIKSGEFNEVVTIYQAGSEPSIVISKNEYVVSSNGETISVEVSSNVDVAVEMPTDADWISENTTSGVSTNTYYFDILPNENFDQRTAEIKFTNNENNLSEVVMITQKQKDAILVAKDSYTVDCEGGQIQIDIDCNVDFYIEINCNWIAQFQTRSLVSDLLIFDVRENVNFTIREAVIKIASKDTSLCQDIKIIQKGGNTNIESPEDGGEFDWE